MSKQDTHFFNVFSVVIGILATFAILIFIFARYVGSRTQEQEVRTETEYIHQGTGNAPQPSNGTLSPRSPAQR